MIMVDGVKVRKSKLVFKGKAFSFYSDEIEYRNKVMRKDYVLYPEAVAIVPVLSRFEFILIRQFRYPVREELLEVPAGKLDPGEDVIDGARRELEEETGFRAREIIKVYEYFPAVGYSSEKLHITVARGLEKTEKRLDEDEFTETEVFKLSEIMEMIKSGKIKDAKTVLSFLLIKELGVLDEI